MLASPSPPAEEWGPSSGQEKGAFLRSLEDGFALLRIIGTQCTESNSCLENLRRLRFLIVKAKERCLLGAVLCFYIIIYFKILIEIP